ncbi:Snake venom serine protease 3 [Zancudomyces culisetae]|uniref:Snake venom serine protease 3 n=1 Tax=Zancudomyces culisetae TaxID=1213189 RepID=A0A1R1PXS6_ZANCU|nr:Snake venom serine protease 3 [Zancudomyces culisetae]|eukprot:OMH85766.1 Snake venom serine protease 3 [Zancudomyces culisetae]
MYNGTLATLDEFPGIANVIIGFNGFAKSCTGTLITNEAVLTAAHCLEKDGVLGLAVNSFVGVDSLQDALNNNKTIRVKKLEVYPGYFTNNLEDLGIVHLDRRYDNLRASTIKVVGEHVLHNTKLSAAGWGATEDSSNEQSTKNRGRLLKKIDFSVTQYPLVGRTVALALINKKVFCAKVEDGQALGSGDSGGPAVVDVNGAKLQAGISALSLSWMDPGISSFEFSCFVNVFNYINWIASVIGVSPDELIG